MLTSAVLAATLLAGSAAVHAGGPVIIDVGDGSADGRSTDDRAPIPVDYADRAPGTEDRAVRIVERPGVVWQSMVIRPASTPVFYGDGFYWMYDGSHWFRSRTFDGGFTYVRDSAVPWGVRDVDEPAERHENQAYPTYPLNAAYPIVPAYPGPILAP